MPLGVRRKPRQLKVAVTRTKEAIMTIRYTAILARKLLWRTFLSYIHANGPEQTSGEYANEVLDLAPQDMNTHDFDRRSLKDDDTNENVDRPWRDGK